MILQCCPTVRPAIYQSSQPGLFCYCLIADRVGRSSILPFLVCNVLAQKFGHHCSLHQRNFCQSVLSFVWAQGYASNSPMRQHQIVGTMQRCWMVQLRPEGIGKHCQWWSFASVELDWNTGQTSSFVGGFSYAFLFFSWFVHWDPSFASVKVPLCGGLPGCGRRLSPRRLLHCNTDCKTSSNLGCILKSGQKSVPEAWRKVHLAYAMSQLRTCVILRRNESWIHHEEPFVMSYVSYVSLVKAGTWVVHSQSKLQLRIPAWGGVAQWYFYVGWAQEFETLLKACFIPPSCPLKGRFLGKLCDPGVFDSVQFKLAQACSEGVLLDLLASKKGTKGQNWSIAEEVVFVTSLVSSIQVFDLEL